MNTTYLARLARFTLGTLLAAALLAVGAVFQGVVSTTAAETDQTDTPETIGSDSDDQAFNPFPSSTTMTDTVHAILKAYNERMATAGLAAADVGSQDITSWTIIYVPMMRSSKSPGSAPDPVAPTPTPKPHEQHADVAATIWPDPSIRVARGGVIEYEIRLTNYGKAIARNTRVTLPFSKQQLQVIDGRLTRAGDWVSDLTDSSVTVTFGEIRADESASATIVFRVGGELATDTVLSLRATYGWSDRAGGGDGSSNWAPVLVGGGNDSAPWAWTIVSPLSGQAGTRHHFFSDRFIPGEGIITWLNTPTGVRGLDLRGVADTMGRVYLPYYSSGLKPGTYQLVLYGARSGLTGVATFDVQ